jgi:hypothetical protein
MMATTIRARIYTRGEVSFAKFLFLPSWFAKLLETIFSCFAKLDGCQVDLTNCWSCLVDSTTSSRLQKSMTKKPIAKMVSPIGIGPLTLSLSVGPGMV